MAELDMEISLYDMNKQLMVAKEPLGAQEVQNQSAEIATWFSYIKDTYFMLLCHERRDYSIFHFVNGRKRYYEASQELLEVLWNRGEILDINYESSEDMFAIWVKIGSEAFLYHLFPYNLGVIEV